MNTSDNERSIWDDDYSEDDELVIIRNPNMDDAPLPEIVPDMPRRGEPKRFSDTLEESDEGIWKPSKVGGSTSVKNGIDAFKIAIALGAFLAVLAGLGFLLYATVQQYGIG